MADNVAITAGTGTNIAADDIGAGLLVQRTKTTWGPDGTANDADVATGKPLPVQLRGSDGTDRSNLLPVSVTARTGLWNTGTSNSGLIATLLSLQTTELNSLANAALIISSVGGSSGKFTNADTGAAKYGEIHFTLGTVTTMSAGANLAGWFLQSNDSGSTYESLTVVPPRPPDFIVPLDATTGNKVYKAAGRVELPALQFKVLVQNNSGQAFAASGNTIKLAPIAEVL